MDIEFIRQNIWLLGLLAIWEIIWKGLAMWRAARRDETGWFVVILILNTAGILPIIYLLTHKAAQSKH